MYLLRYIYRVWYNVSYNNNNKWVMKMNNDEFIDENASGDEGIECFAVIDPDGYNINLTTVMRA